MGLAARFIGPNSTLTQLVPPSGNQPPKGLSRSAVIFASLDLGGAIDDWIDVSDRLRAAGFTADPVAKREIYLTYHRLNHLPLLTLESGDIAVAFANRAERSCTRTLLLHPNGILFWTFRFSLRESETPRDVDDLFAAVLHHKNVDYFPELSAYYADTSTLAFTPLEPPSHDGGLGIGQSHRRVADALVDHVEARPDRFPHMDFRCIHLVEVEGQDIHAVPLGEWADGFLACQDVDPTPASEALQRSGMATRFPETILISCGSPSVLVISSSVERTDAVLECCAWAHNMWYSARAWIHVLDRAGWHALESRTYSEEELAELGAKLLATSMLKQRISAEMLDVGGANLAFNRNFHRQVVADFYRRFGVPEMTELLFERLRAIDQHHQTLASLIDRGYQEAQRRHSEKLQLLFAGSLAAGLVGLLPPLLAVPAEPAASSYWYTIVLIAVAVIWATAVTIIVRWQVRIDLRPGRERTRYGLMSRSKRSKK